MSSTPAAVQAVPRGGMARLVGRRLTDWLPAVFVLVGIIIMVLVIFRPQGFLGSRREVMLSEQ